MALRRILPALLTVAVVGLGAAGQGTDRADADRLARKLEAVVLRPLQTPPPTSALRTDITDRELNAYLVHHGAAQLPAGVTGVRVALLDAGKFETRAVLDLDRVRTSQPRRPFDPLAYVSGTMELVTVAGLSGSGGKGVLRYESGALGGVPIPRAVLKEVVAYFTRSPEWPEGISFDEPFVLPAGIREVHVRRGLATVVQ